MQSYPDGRLPAADKLISWQKAEFVADVARTQGLKVVTTNGCYDLLHVGHVYALEQSAAMGDVLIVGVNSDLSVRQLKGKRRPIIEEQQRALMVASLRCVAYVVMFGESTPCEWLRMVKPDIHTKGEDYAGRTIPEQYWLDSWGGQLAYTKHYPDAISTSQTIGRICRRYWWRCLWPW